jgi:hypothetical protein
MIWSRLTGLITMSVKLTFIRVVLALGVTSCTSAYAQTPPDAGVLRQQFERDQVMPVLRQIAPEKPADLPVMDSLESTTVTVQAFRFSENTLLNIDTLSLVVAYDLNHPIFNVVSIVAVN